MRLNLRGEPLARGAADEARGEFAEVIEDRPEKLFGHLRGTHLVGVGEIIAAGRGGSPQAGERPGMQGQGVADIVEADAVG